MYGYQGCWNGGYLSHWDVGCCGAALLKVGMAGSIRVGRISGSGPKISWGRGCRTCCLCLEMLESREAQCCCLSPLAAILICATSSPAWDEGCWQTLCSVLWVCEFPSVPITASTEDVVR